MSIPNRLRPPALLAELGPAVVVAVLIEIVKKTYGYSVPGWLASCAILAAVAFGYYWGRGNQSFLSESSKIALTHRVNTEAQKQYYERAFSEGDEILYVTIMSESSVKRGGIEKHLKALKPNAKLRVLTWYADDSVIEAFRKNIGENEHDPKKTIKQVDESLKEWRQLMRDFPSLNFSVKVYESSPTMQGALVRNKWALIEPLPYHIGKDDRPGIILTHADAPQTLALLWKAFDDLFEHGARQLTEDWPPKRP